MKRRTLLITAACSLSTQLVQAQTYPTRSVRIVVPFAPGGATDALARAIAQKLTEMYGQGFIVDNRPGAGGNIGTELVAKSPADGYTMLLTINSHVINPLLYSNLRYDAEKDFQPLTLVATAPNALVARPGFPARTIPELIALAKANPGKFTFASAGTGSGSHLAGVLFNSMAGVQLTHVPYKGVTPAITDVMGGQVDLCFSVLSVIYPLVKADKLQGIAITSAKRAPLLPELPTVAETLPGYDVFSWFGLLLPANCPRDVFEKLQSAVMQILQAPELKRSFEAQGIELVGNSSRDFTAFLQSDQTLWAKVIKANNIRLD